MIERGPFQRYEFLWDKGNLDHLYIDNAARGITVDTVITCFNDPNLLIGSMSEQTKIILAKADNKIYRVIFEIREERIRLVTIYPASKKHRLDYEQAQRTDF